MAIGRTLRDAIARFVSVEGYDLVGGVLRLLRGDRPARAPLLRKP